MTSEGEKGGVFRRVGGYIGSASQIGEQGRVCGRRSSRTLETPITLGFGFNRCDKAKGLDTI